MPPDSSPWYRVSFIGANDSVDIYTTIETARHYLEVCRGVRGGGVIF